MANISLKNIRKVYPPDVTAVDGFNLEIEDRRFVVLVGPSGCGKTTVLRMIAGLEEITGGELRIGGQLMNEVPPKNRDIAMVFQNYALYPHMTVFKNMSFSLELRKVPKAEIKRRVEEAARILDIERLLHRKPKALSGGQRQRVALGRAMVREPAVFLLDEPLSNLDAKLRASMRTELIKLHRRLETTFVYVTHDQTEAMTMGELIVVMKDGFIQQIDTPQNLYDRPCNAFVAGFIGNPQMNFMNGVLERDERGFHMAFAKDRIYFPKERQGGWMEAYSGKPVKLGVRPEDIYDDEASLDKYGDAVINAHVEVSELMGSEVYLYLEREGMNLTARVGPGTTSRTGDKVKVAIDMGKAHLFDPENENALSDRQGKDD
ncbi:MAG: sn-glycerol-3-phosphate ABC transporter ATP-binding protein UgpC [Clostridiales Family XIII bacterium]|jgi:multiple sugar transport system ATP-binding protein|nr:sn-glycerol-3-phosphate ABC transporter ATP-binding protein UgpC [Clostridiales Family XIII bacterium]